MFITNTRCCPLFGTKTNDLGGFYDLYHALKTEPALGAAMGGVMSTLFAVAISIRTELNDYWNVSRTNRYGRILKIIHSNWMRRLITRSLAVIPVIICLIIFRGNAEK